MKRTISLVCTQRGSGGGGGSISSSNSTLVAFFYLPTIKVYMIRNRRSRLLSSEPLAFYGMLR